MKVKVTEILTQLGEQIKTNLASNDVNASGRTSRSIKVVDYGEGVKLVSDKSETLSLDTPRGTAVLKAAPMETTEIGREGGRVPRGFYYIIKQWSKEKGLNFDTESERGTFAYFVAQKIAREGTARHKQRIDVYSQAVTQAKPTITNAVGGAVSQMFSSIKIHLS